MCILLSMRLCHFSDSHLGAGENHPRRGETGLTVRQEDFVNAFIAAVDRIIQLKPDLCIHSGDLFHTVRPINRIMAIAAEQLHRLAAEAGIPTVIIAGNHDAPRQPRVGAALEVFTRIENLHVAASGQLEVFELEPAIVYALPHCLTPASVQDQLAKCQPERESSSKHHILVMHGVAAGMPEFSMADLAEQELPLDVMARFDYTALGHYHNSVQVGSRAWYAGATERLSQAERDAAKGFIEVTLDPFDVVFHELSVRPMVDMKPIRASGKHGGEVVEEIRRELSQVDSGDKVVRVTVSGVSPETLRTIPPEAIAELKDRAFAVDIRFEKEKVADDGATLGKSALGRLDKGFIEFLETTDLEGVDRERLVAKALEYLQSDYTSG
ncbi:hypothetical protein GF377_09865 [candidate division GN15 bacterium]|nr:hypothetical protein [candidate division GN15 bacterium]